MKPLKYCLLYLGIRYFMLAVFSIGYLKPVYNGQPCFLCFIAAFKLNISPYLIYWHLDFMKPLKYLFLYLGKRYFLCYLNIYQPVLSFSIKFFIVLPFYISQCFLFCFLSFYSLIFYYLTFQ